MRLQSYAETRAAKVSRVSEALGSSGGGILRNRCESVSSAGVHPARRLNCRLDATMRFAV
jgi:hypothetical protein